MGWSIWHNNGIFVTDDLTQSARHAFLRHDFGDVPDLDLALALKEIFGADNEIRIIGTRHGEKLYETLLTREEMAVAQDAGEYYRVPSDNRDLNYEQYFSTGSEKVGKVEDYNSHNTRRLDVDGMIELLKKLDIVQRAVAGEKVDV